MDVPAIDDRIVAASAAEMLGRMWAFTLASNSGDEKQDDADHAAGSKPKSDNGASVASSSLKDRILAVIRIFQRPSSC